MEDPDNNRPQPNHVIGFIMTVVVGIGLTVIAVPFLLLVTCLPMITGNYRPTLIAAGVYAAVAFFGGVVIAIRTRNTGIRWGVIALFCFAVMVAARYFL